MNDNFKVKDKDENVKTKDKEFLKTKQTLSNKE